MRVPCIRHIARIVVYEIQGEISQARRQRIGPVIVRNTQSALERDPALGIPMYLRESKYQVIVLQFNHGLVLLVPFGI